MSIGPDRPISNERRLTLPVLWGTDEPRRLILDSRIRPPAPSIPFRQALLLDMGQVEGILSLHLNGQPLTIDIR